MRQSAEAAVVCLLGPTASGKTEVALTLAASGPFDIVSVDSAMVYRGLDIGTAKPDSKTLADFPHALVDVCDPRERFSVADFVAAANQAIANSHAGGRVPLLVGGTMLYFKRLFDGLAALPAADLSVRAQIDAEAAEHGWPTLHASLASVDPTAAKRIAPGDAQRIQRALEVFRLTGLPISELQRRATPAAAQNFVKIALLSEDRETIHQRIAARFEHMLAVGFEQEVADLLAQPGIHAGLASMRSVGYRQMAAYLAGDSSREQAVADAKTATRRLAKRQHTWLRGMHGLQIVDPLQTGVAERVSALLR
ncbi:MAG: tRNA (adenosine(37)-N6)-dimethylallyltransferase MiaA [Pseudomonadota bacterium]